MLLGRAALLLVGLGPVVLGLPAAAEDAGPPKTTLTFDLQGGTIGSSSNASNAPAGSLMAHFCWPPAGDRTQLAGDTQQGTLIVGPDGAIQGNCSLARSASGVDIQRTSNLTGQYDQVAQTMSFRMTGHEDYAITAQGSRTGTAMDITLVADKVPVSDGTATGAATVDYTCTAQAGMKCEWTSLTGTVNFTMAAVNASDPLRQAPANPAPGGADSAALPPGATGETAAEPSSGSSTGRAVGFAALAAVALGLGGAGIAWARHRRRRELANPPDTQMAAVTADRLGGFEDSPSYADGAGKAIPGVSRAYESLLVAQSPATRPEDVLKSPAGATEDDLRPRGVVRDVSRARGGAGSGVDKPRDPPKR